MNNSPLEIRPWKGFGPFSFAMDRKEIIRTAHLAGHSVEQHGSWIEIGTIAHYHFGEADDPELPTWVDLLPDSRFSFAELPFDVLDRNAIFQVAKREGLLITKLPKTSEDGLLIPYKGVAFLFGESSRPNKMRLWPLGAYKAFWKSHLLEEERIGYRNLYDDKPARR